MFYCRDQGTFKSSNLFHVIPEMEVFNFTFCLLLTSSSVSIHDKSTLYGQIVANSFFAKHSRMIFYLSSFSIFPVFRTNSTVKSDIFSDIPLLRGQTRDFNFKKPTRGMF